MANADVSAVAYCLLIDGIAVSFWTNEDAASTVDVGRTTTHSGLEFPSVSMGLNLASNWLTSQSATFHIQDNDGTLADLFASVRDDAEPLSSTLEAGDVGGASVQSKHVGTEYIGSSGERRQYPAIEGFNVGERLPGTSETQALGIGDIPVSAKPLVWSGRRCALYRFKKVDGTWQTWSESARIWWGTLRGTGHVKAHRWELRADGPQSWLQKPAGFSAFSEPAAVEDAQILLDDNAKDVHVRFLRQRPTADDFLQIYGEHTATIAGDTVSDVETAFSTAISTALSATGPDGTEFDGTDGTQGTTGREPRGNASIEGDTGNAIQIEIEDGTINGGSGSGLVAEGIMRITAHSLAWRSLGYDPEIQSDPGLEFGDSPQTYVPFIESNGLYGSPAGAGYWTAVISTKAAGALNDFFLYDNDGQPRWYEPIFGSGTDETYTLPSSAGVELYLNQGPGEGWVVEGQHDIPPAEDPASPGTAYTFASGSSVDATRLFAFVGPRRIQGSEDEFTCVWVGRVSWNDVDGRIGDLDAPEIYVSEWLDAGAFGFQSEVPDGNTIETDWLAPKGSIVCVPLHNITHRADGNSSNPVRLVRNMLVTSGTGTGWWTDNSYTTRQYGNGGKLKPGDNNLNTYSLRPADYEISDLGCAIPASMVQAPVKWSSVEQKLAAPLRAVAPVFVGGFNLDDVILGMLRPIGLCLGLPGGKYGIVAPWDGVSSDDIAHTITPESYSADQPKDGIQSQTMMAHTPSRLVRINYGWNPVDASFALEHTMKATDQGARFRRNGSEIEIDAPGYGVSPGFLLELNRRWRKLFTYYNARNFAVKGVRLHFNDNIWPGDLVSWTDPWLVSQAGAYGVTGAVGIVTSVTHRAKSEETVVDAVLFEQPTDGYRMVAPSARVVRYDSGGPTLYCEKDWLSVSVAGFEHIDVAAFAEPEWSSDGGNASIQVLQYDGNTWTTAGYQTVASVDTAANTITLSGTLSGGTGYYRDRDSVVVFREFANQGAAWVLNNYAPIAADDGTVGGNAADAVKWNDLD